MRSATRYALAAFAFVLWSGSAAAQNDVTFQVNLQPFVDSCQFDPATETVYVRGSFQAGDGYNLDNPLTSAGNGLYTGTASAAVGDIQYKFYTGTSADGTVAGILGWEDDSPENGTGNRDYTVTAGAQTIPAVDFNKPVDDRCSATMQDYDLIFQVDMSIQQGRGAFDPSAGAQAGINGEVPNGWDNANPALLIEDSFTPGVYTTVLQRMVTVPSATGFKFVIKPTAGDVGWENLVEGVTPDQVGGNRVIRITGNETDGDGNGRPDFTYDNDGDATTPVFFSDQTAADFLDGDATVTFNVDLRSAQSALAANGSLPGGAMAINGLFINGPAAGESSADGGPGGGIGDWAGWGDPLAAQTARQLTNNGDGTYSITLNYAAGARRQLVAKFGVNGLDNESGFGGDHQLPITTGATTYNLAFGCVRQANGRFVDQTGSAPEFNTYDEYLLIDNSATPPTCVTVTSGGIAGDINFGVANENGPSIAGIEIGAAYPNPVRASGQIDLTLDRAMTISARVYDVMGREVATLAEGRQVQAGTLALPIDVRSLASGVYVLRVEADGQVATRRMTVTR